ncbi:DUF6520 family protein [Flavobacterium sp.]|uniref:DUF6520 family protein n=1 Tax=Flavobacterium sp. TaxID=239 RepID=UPI002603B6A4|nr:DUF6520 family protein [Flavobacterium sp.]
MKNSFSKKIIPILVIVLAITGAFATNASIRSNGVKLALIQGYIRNNPVGTDCIASVMCADVVNNICTVTGLPGGIQVWGKNSAGRCIVEVYKIP